MEIQEMQANHGNVPACLDIGMDRSSVREVLFAPIILCVSMVLCALITGLLAGVSSERLYLPYIRSFIAFSFLSLLLSLFWWVVNLASSGADRPLLAVRERLLKRAPLLLLPTLIFPTFLAGFTGTKSAIPFLVGYTWDPFWAHADRLIFGDDVWRIAHRWLGDGASRPLEWFYVAAWGSGLIFIAAFVALNASVRFVGRFYTAMMATWLLGGAAMAYLFSAAGPVFAHFVAADRAVQFNGLRQFLNSTLLPHGPIETGQRLLPLTMHSHVAVMGGGVSAMPSMHLATVSIYVLAARRTRLFIPALLFWGVIFVASGYFGYHYWIDGIVSAVVASGCWIAADRVVGSLAVATEQTRLPELGVTGACASES